MKQFPVGCCKTASLLLARYLVRELRFRPVSFVSALDHYRQPTPVSHLWLEYSGILIDITADQFSGIDEPVIVTDDRSWHDNTFPTQTTFDFETEERQFNNSYRAKFEADYFTILNILSGSTTYRP